MMVGSSTNPGISQKLYDTIMGWDMSKVRARLKFKEKLTDEQLDALELGYKQYVVMMVKNPGEKFVVSVEIDEFSHNFILFTEDFATFQQAINGRVDHLPVRNEEEVVALTEKYHLHSIPTLIALFGSAVNMALWGPNRMICTCIYIPEPAM